MIKRGFKYISKVPKVVYWKIKYFPNLKIHILQSLSWNTKIFIKRGARLKIGHSFETRSGVNLRVEKGNLSIGKGCFINTNTSITVLEKIIIGDNCKIGNNVVFVDHDHDIQNPSNSHLISSPINIGNNVWIGANSVILRGTNIGDNSVIGAGSIVKGNIEKNTLLFQERTNIHKKIEVGG